MKKMKKIPFSCEIDQKRVLINTHLRKLRVILDRACYGDIIYIYEICHATSDACYVRQRALIFRFFFSRLNPKPS